MSARIALALDESVGTHLPAAKPYRATSTVLSVIRFHWNPTLAALSPGWYVFDAQAEDATTIAPHLVVDYGNGFDWPERTTPLLPGLDGRFRSVVVIKRPPQALGIIAPADGSTPWNVECALQGISRSRAIIEMLRGIHQALPGAGVMPGLRALRAFVWAYASGDRESAALVLVDHYQAARRLASSSYARWIDVFETSNPTSTTHRQVTTRGGEPSAGPLLSILLPIHEPRPAMLRRTLRSVTEQTYPGLQLCLALDPSASAPVREVVDDIAREDRRVCVARVDHRGNVCIASNAALALARGSHVALLGQEDELSPVALAEVCRMIQARPDAGFIYSDEDRLDAAGERDAPNFKPEWSPDLPCGRDALTHLAVIDTALARRVGGFDIGFEGAHAYEFALRCVDALDPDRIVHLPRVLYHRRSGTESGWDRGGGAVADGKRALEAHLARRQVVAEVEVSGVHGYRIRRPLPTPAPRIDVLIPTRDQHKLLRRCIDSLLLNTRYPDFRICVLDNGSSEPNTLRYLDLIAADARITVSRLPGAFNFSRIVNQGVAQTHGGLVCLLNDDVEALSPDWLQEMAAHALRAEVGAVGAMLYFPDGRMQHAGVVTGIGGVAAHVHYGIARGSPGYFGRTELVQNYTAVTGACMLFQRSRFEEVGGFDEQLAVCYNDVDFCLRLRARGYYNVWTPYAELWHHESATRGSDDTPKKRTRHRREYRCMQQRWGDVLRLDPAYNPNLSLHGEGFDLAFPPREGHRIPCFPRLTERPHAEAVAERGSSRGPSDTAEACVQP